MWTCKICLETRIKEDTIIYSVIYLLGLLSVITFEFQIGHGVLVLHVTNDQSTKIQ